MKYILIITAAFLFGCGNKEADQQAQVQHIIEKNRAADKVIEPIKQESYKKIVELIKAGKRKEAEEVSDEFRRKRDSIMRIN